MNVNVNADANKLEDRYQRLLRLLPAAYRERRADEMLGTLLDSAADDQRWPRPAEVISLAALSVRLRTGAPGGSERASTLGEVMQRLALVGMTIQVLYYASILSESVVAYVNAPGASVNRFDVLWSTLVLAESALPAAALVYLLRGRNRRGRVLALLCTALMCVDLILTLVIDLQGLLYFMGEFVVAMVGPALVTLLSTVAVLLGFHRDAPTATAPGRWLRILAVSLPLVVFWVGLAQYLQDHASEEAEWFITAAHLTVSPIVPAVAVLFGFSRAVRPVAWSIGLLLVSIPVVGVLIPMAMFALDRIGIPQMSIGSAWLGGSLAEVAWQAIVTQLILAAACWSGLRRGGRSMTPTVAVSHS
jgi:hypothetical protein